MSEQQAELKLKTTWIYQIVTLAEIKHLQRAAKHLGISVQTLKTNLSSCEQTLGFPLFVRQEQRLLLTPAGSLFLHQAHELLKDLRLVEALFDEEPQQALFRVGYSSELARVWLTDWVLRMHEREPDRRISLIQSRSALLIQGLSDDSLQMVIGTQPIEQEGFQNLRLQQVPGVIVTAPGVSGSWREQRYVVCQQVALPGVSTQLHTDFWFYAILLAQQMGLALYAPLPIVQPWLDAGKLSRLPEQPALPQQALFLSWKQRARLAPLLRWTLHNLWEADRYEAQA